MKRQRSAHITVNGRRFYYPENAGYTRFSGWKLYSSSSHFAIIVHLTSPAHVRVIGPEFAGISTYIPGQAFFLPEALAEPFRTLDHSYVGGQELSIQEIVEWALSADEVKIPMSLTSKWPDWATDRGQFAKPAASVSKELFQHTKEILGVTVNQTPLGSLDKRFSTEQLKTQIPQLLEGLNARGVIPNSFIDAGDRAFVTSHPWYGEGSTYQNFDTSRRLYLVNTPAQLSFALQLVANLQGVSHVEALARSAIGQLRHLGVKVGENILWCSANENALKFAPPQIKTRPTTSVTYSLVQAPDAWPKHHEMLEEIQNNHSIWSRYHTMFLEDMRLCRYLQFGIEAGNIFPDSERWPLRFRRQSLADLLPLYHELLAIWQAGFYIEELSEHGILLVIPTYNLEKAV